MADSMPAWGDELAARRLADDDVPAEGDSDLCRCEHARWLHEHRTGGCDPLTHRLCGCMRFRPNTGRRSTCYLCQQPTSENAGLCIRCENEERHLDERREL